MMLEPLGLAAGPVVPTREWRELYAALDCAVGRRDPSVLHRERSASSRRRAGRSSAPRRSAYDGTAAWLEAIGDACGRRARRRSTPPRTAFLPAIKAALAQAPIKGRITLSRLRGLGAAGRAAADRERRGRAATSAPPARARSGSRRRPRVARGAGRARRSTAPRSSRTSRRCDEFEPDLAIGTTPVVQKAKEPAIPALYFTNLISARPLMGAAGAGSLGAGRQCGARQQGALRRDEGVLRGRRRGRHRRRLGGRARRHRPSSASNTRSSLEKQAQAAQEPRR